MSATRPLLAPLFLAAAFLLSACSGDPVQTVQQTRMAPDESVTVEQAFARYPYFTKVAWSGRAAGDDRHIVEAVCDVDLAANCRNVSAAALNLAQRDVARDYLLARFEVVGFPARVRVLELRHVTQCSSGKRLGLADPKYLAAIYNGERIRFFCLEGLNCPGNGGQQAAPAP